VNIAAVFIRRPIATTLCMASILLFGVIGYRLLPVSDLPNADFPYITVTAELPGASPATMAAAVATPLEKEFSTIAGIDAMTSSSTQDRTTITIQFALDRNIDAAAQDVQAAIARAAKRLPTNMPNPPYYRKANPADYPILYLSLTSASLPMSVLDELGQTLMAQRISMVEGVAQVLVYGSQKYAVRIGLDPRALTARGIGLDEVANVVSQYNVLMPLGLLNGPDKVSSIQANGQLTDASQYLPLIVAYRGGQPVRLREVGTATDSVENDKVAAWYGEDRSIHRSIVLAIQKQPGTNTVEVAAEVKALLPSLREKMPADVSMELWRDNSDTIRESARDVQFTLLLTLALVVMVIFLFLRNLSATVIPSLTLPMSIVGTFAAMYLLDYSLDNLSLMALTLSVGFVVDDAIVMLENIVRHMEMGKGRFQAAMDGAREIGFTILSMTLSLAAVFVPFLLMGGLVGRLFREFSVTIGVAVLVSGFISLTLTPMLSSRFLKDPGHVRHGMAYRATEAGFNAMLRFYGWSLNLAIRHKPLTMLAALAILAGSGWLFLRVPKGFIPSEDRDQMMITTEAAQDISFDSMRAHQLAVADIVRKTPEVRCFMCAVGVGGPSGSSNQGRMYLVLKPRGERTRSADELVQDFRVKLAAVPGIRVMPINPPVINLGAGRVSKALYQYTLLGADTDELYRSAAVLEEKIRQLPNFQDVSSDLQMKNPQLNVEIDRDQAFVRNVTPMQIEAALGYAYGGIQISTIYTPNNQYQVILELQKPYQRHPSLLSMLYVRSSKGQLVPLSAVTTLREDVGPLQVNHTGQLPSVTIFFNLKPGVSLDQGIKDIRQAAGELLSGAVSGSFQGATQAFLDALRSMGILFILTVVIIYVVLGVLYESFYHPITILSALPFATFGALLTLLIFRAELTIYAFVGIIMLIGLVKKNGIMMIDFAIDAQRQGGKTPAEAIHEASMVRFRPIMMTTMAALMAGLPIALGFGAGAESRRPLGLAVTGGLLFSQALTLYVTPVFYIYMEKLRAWIAALSRPAAAPPAAGDSPKAPVAPAEQLAK